MPDQKIIFFLPKSASRVLASQGLPCLIHELQHRIHLRNSFRRNFYQAQKLRTLHVNIFSQIASVFCSTGANDMFAVPGWSLSPALLKRQVDSEADAGSSKKRKRKQNDAAENVTNSIDELYKKHVEKEVPQKAVQPKKTEKNDGQSGERQQSTSNEETVKQKPARASMGKSQKAEFRKAKREAQSIADKQKALEVRRESGLPEKKKSKKDKKHKQHDDSIKDDSTKPDKVQPDNATSLPPPPPAASAKLTPLQTAMRQKLIGARFRHLNQTLYTSPSADASTLFEANPTFFEEYHAGFRSQVESWPENPVDSFVQEIAERAKVRAPAVKDGAGVLPLPMTKGTCRVADLGCGDAALASKVSKLRLNVQVLSYDLAKPNKYVTKADIANLPLEDDSVNVAIFCLALMGTNWIDFIEEAWRVLHWKGELWIAEIKSRFGRVQNRRVEHSVGFKQKKRPSKQDLQQEKQRAQQSDERQLMQDVDEVPMNIEGTDVSAFVQVLRLRGFALQDEHSIDLGNKMFVKMKFVKSLPPLKGKNLKEDKQGGSAGKKKAFIEKENQVVDEPAVLKPCLYKIR